MSQARHIRAVARRAFGHTFRLLAAAVFLAAEASGIARWCFNSADGGLYLASKLTEMVVRAASTGLRVWSWGSTEMLPKLVVGDRVAVITDQYTDYDPSRSDHYYYSYVPYPGHVAANFFRQFHDAAATCFLTDACGTPAP